MKVPDASVWVSHLVPQEANHAASRRWFREVVSSGTAIAAPAILLAEVAGAMVRRTGDAELGHKAARHILSTPNLRLVSIDEELAMLTAHLAAAQRLRGADATYVAVAQRLNIPLVTWDQEQRDRASAVVSARTPAEDQ
jgi:predicted nucleic acid-binding protein